MEWIEATLTQFDGRTETALVLTDGIKAYASMRLKQTDETVAKEELALISFEYDFDNGFSKPIFA